MNEPSESELEPYEAHAWKGYFGISLTLCIGFLIMCVDLMVRGWWGGEAPGGLLGMIPPGVLGGIGTAYLGVVSVNLFRMIADSRPRLQISEEGIVNRTYSSSATLVPWEDIIEIRKTRKWGIMEIVLRDPAAFREEQSPLARFVMRATKVLGLGAFPIHLWQLDADNAEVTRRLEEAMHAAELAPLRDQMALEGDVESEV